MIVNPDGTKVRPEIRLAAGAAGFNDPEPVLLSAVPVVNTGILTSVPLKKVNL